MENLDKVINIDDSQMNNNKVKYDEDSLLILKIWIKKLNKGDRLTKEDLIFLHENLNENQICFGFPEEYFKSIKLKYKEGSNNLYFIDY